jgi:hypothetical protein
MQPSHGYGKEDIYVKEEEKTLKRGKIEKDRFILCSFYDLDLYELNRLKAGDEESNGDAECPTVTSFYRQINK